MIAGVRPPDGFTVLDAPPDDGVWAAVEDGDEPASGFRASLVLTVEALPAGTTVDALTDEALAIQDEVLSAHHLLDRHPERLAGREATRTLAHHIFGLTAVTIEQWRVVAGDRGVTLTASCATLDWPALTDTLAEAAATLEVTA